MRRRPTGSRPAPGSSKARQGVSSTRTPGDRDQPLLAPGQGEGRRAGRTRRGRGRRARARRARGPGSDASATSGELQAGRDVLRRRFPRRAASPGTGRRGRPRGEQPRELRAGLEHALADAHPARAAAASRPLRCWISVVLPEPMAPMMPRISPGRAARSTPRRTGRSRGGAGGVGEVEVLDDDRCAAARADLRRSCRCAPPLRARDLRRRATASLDPATGVSRTQRRGPAGGGPRMRAWRRPAADPRGAPSQTTEPRCSTSTRSPRAASSTSLVKKTVALPAARERARSFSTSARPGPSSSVSGSSSTSSGGSAMSTEAMASSCFCPPESCPGCDWAWPARPISASIAVDRAVDLRGVALEVLQDHPHLLEDDGRGEAVLGVLGDEAGGEHRARVVRRRRWRGTTVPAVGAATPASSAARVLLPAPFAPSTTSDSPGRISSETSRSAGRLPPPGSG